MIKALGKTAFVTGLLLIAAALFLVGWNLRQEGQSGQSAASVLTELTEIAEERRETERAAATSVNKEEPYYEAEPLAEMPLITIDGRDYIGTISIPCLELELPILSTWDYPGLRIAPCRFYGSAYTDSLILAAHNYQSHFGRIKELGEGDSVYVTDADGNVFAYKVVLTEILGPQALEEMLSGDWALTLFTCTLGGKSRVTVRCERA